MIRNPPPSKVSPRASPATATVEPSQQPQNHLSICPTGQTSANPSATSKLNCLFPPPLIDASNLPQTFTTEKSLVLFSKPIKRFNFVAVQRALKTIGPISRLTSRFLVA